ncbi:autotransporter domain-containing protein [Pseudomonas sp. MWU12-2345]|uniref:autotransporter outer membrane beta-barrel domain-containing protein n=1 Tax=Pseudomonas sp. MWU12-2345 TaxID=2928689 RepID=UPI00200D2AC9|nr:autotransporter domain-containing protein [Pseudomonas sp. MWU12-2345]
MPPIQHPLGWAVALALCTAFAPPLLASSRVSRGDTLYVEHLGDASSIMASSADGLFTWRNISLRNDGVVKGLSGSGVRAYGNGTVLNWGRISGDRTEGVFLTGYNGVRIDGLARVENYGVIEADVPKGVGSSSGLSIGRGLVVNAEDALIQGPSFGILGQGKGPINVVNRGIIRGHRGIRLNGNHDDSVTNHGLIETTYIQNQDPHGSTASAYMKGAYRAGTAIDLGGGNDTLALYSGSQVFGAIDGGSGSDLLLLEGGSGMLGNTRNFESLSVNQGTWTLTGPADFSAQARVGNGAELINNGGITGATWVDQFGVYSGSGSTDSLVVNGTMFANSQSGAPIVTRDLTMGPSSMLVYGIDRDGGSSTIDVGGTAYLQGATLVLRPTADSVPSTSAHTVLRAGQVEGAFHKVVSDLAFMTYRLSYTPTDVGLIYSRNYVPLEQIAESGNAKRLAASLGQTAYFAPAPAPDGQHVDDTTAATPVAVGQASQPPALVSSLITSNAATAKIAMSQLSGSHNANLGNATLGGAGQVGGGMLSAMRQWSDDRRLPGFETSSGRPATLAFDADSRGAKGRVWVHGLGNAGKLESSQQNDQAMQRKTQGLLIGSDWARAADWRFGVVGGQSQTRLDGSHFKGTIDSWHLGAYALHQSGPWATRLGAVHSRHDGNTRRDVAFAGFSERLSGRHQASSQQLFSEIGYALGFGNLSVEPFAGLDYQRYHRRGYTEKGGDAALSVKAHSQGNLRSTLGARFAQQHQLDRGMSLAPRLSAGWKHRYGQLTHAVMQSSALGGDAFEIRSATLDRDSLVVDAGLDWRFSENHALGVGYTGEIADNRQLHGVQGEWTLRF